jgi:hypothetical protein
MAARVMKTTLEPFLNRQPDDHRAALGAFQRLYVYGGATNDPALRAVAVLKAIQKLEQLDEEETKQNAPSPITLPAWVRAGFWETLQTLVGKSPPGNTAKKRSVTFERGIGKVMRFYSSWAAVMQYVLEDGMTRTDAIMRVSQDGAGDPRTVKRHVDNIDKRIAGANALSHNGDDGKALPYVEARDLIPTQKFKLLMDKFA